MNLELLSKLLKADNNFTGTPYQSIVKEAQDFFNNDMIDEACKMLCKLPTEEDLLRDLIEKLKGKSVYKTLKKMNEGKIKNTSDILKGLFSLGTHIIIESEKGKREYKMLLPLIHEKIGELVYDVS